MQPQCALRSFCDREPSFTVRICLFRVILAACLVASPAWSGRSNLSLHGRVAPVSGAAFLKPHGLVVLPSPDADADDGSYMATRLLPNEVDTGSPHECDGGKQADKGKCLSHPTRKCMWTRVESRNPLLPVQESYAYCLPCELDGTEMPCWNIGAWVDGKQVTDCDMSCAHHKKIRQPQYACSDTSGFISGSQCFDKGSRSGSKCMFISFEDEAGNAKASCGPCTLVGTGDWGCPKPGDAGPDAGSKVTSCASQCAAPCAGPPDCPPTIAPPPPLPPPSPGVAQTNADADQMVSAPAAFPMPTINPYQIMMSAAKGAEKAGFVVGTPPPPPVYFPVIMYRSPLDLDVTTVPPPTMYPMPAFLQERQAMHTTPPPQQDDRQEARVAAHFGQPRSGSL